MSKGKPKLCLLGKIVSLHYPPTYTQQRATEFERKNDDISNVSCILVYTICTNIDVNFALPLQTDCISIVQNQHPE